MEVDLQLESDLLDQLNFSKTGTTSREEDLYDMVRFSLNADRRQEKIAIVHLLTGSCLWLSEVSHHS